MRPNTTRRLRITIVFVVAALVAVVAGSAVALADMSPATVESSGSVTWGGQGNGIDDDCLYTMTWILTAGSNSITSAKLFVDFGSGPLEYSPSKTTPGATQFTTPGDPVTSAYATYSYTGDDPSPNLTISHCNIPDGTTTTLAGVTTTTLAQTTTTLAATTTTLAPTTTTLAPTTTTLAPTTTTLAPTTTTLAPTTTTEAATSTTVGQLTSTTAGETTTSLVISGTTTTEGATTTIVGRVTSTTQGSGTTVFGWIDTPDDIQTGMGGTAGGSHGALIVLILASTMLVSVLVASALGIRAGVL